MEKGYNTVVVSLVLLSFSNFLAVSSPLSQHFENYLFVRYWKNKCRKPNTKKSQGSGCPVQFLTPSQSILHAPKCSHLQVLWWEGWWQKKNKSLLWSCESFSLNIWRMYIKFTLIYKTSHWYSHWYSYKQRERAAYDAWKASAGVAVSLGWILQIASWGVCE